MATINDTEGFKRLMQACSVLFDIHPSMLHDMIVNKCSPIILDGKIQNAGKNFMNNLNKTEQTIVRSIKTEGYSKMDGSLFYKLIRHFELVNMPSEGWGKQPKPHAINQGDDVERLRYLRNSVFHRTQSAMTPTESKSFFEGFRQCAERLDRYMQRSTNVFTDKITKVQSTTVNDAASRIYHDQFEDTLQMTETSSWNKVDSSGCYKLTLYCSNILREEIGNDANKENGLKDETIVIRGLVDENAIVEAIKREKGHLNKVFTEIRVNSIEKGSVVFFVSLDNMAFVSLQMLSKQVQSFVNWILDIPDVNMMIKNDLDILLIPIDFISTREKEYTMQCENCDTPLLPDSKFCHKCGENIDKKSICSKCNNAVTKENNYCPTCGEKLRRDLHALKSTVNMTEENQGERVFNAQSAIKGPRSLEEVKQLMKKINEEGSEKFMEHLNKTLDKWKNEKVKFGLAGGSTMGKSSFVNVLTGHTEDNENRAKTSAGGNTTVSSTEYSDARQKISSFTYCPGYGTPDFTYTAYLRQNSIDTFDYVLIFFSVVTTDDIYFAKALDERKMKFCFVRTKLDIDIDSARYDNPQDTDPHLIAETLRQTAVDAIEKQGLLNPIVFVISNRRKDLGHFPNLLSHIEQVLHKEKYHALIYEISTYTRDAIKRKHKLLCDRINSVTMRAVVEEGEDATDFDSGNVEDEKKRIKLQKTVQWLERELLFYIETFELNKKTSIALIGQERVRQKMKFASLLTSGIENCIADFITKQLDSLLDKSRNDPQVANADDIQLEYPFLYLSRKLLSAVLDGLQEDAFIIFEEFQKKEC